MADVLLTHSYHLPYDRKQLRKKQPYPPLGTLYAASVLRQNGVSVAVFDTMLNNPTAGFREALRVHRPKIVAIYEDDFNFLSKMCLTRMGDVARQMLYQAQEAGARVIAHGSDATDHALEYLEYGFDFVLIGAAEHTLLGVVRAICSGADASEIAGVASLRPGGSRKIKQNPSASRPVLAELPLPARDLIDIEEYRQAWLSAHGTFSLNMVASRGCPFRCNWCAKPIFGDTFDVRPAEEVAEEMKILKEEYKATHIWFADDIFALNRRWTQQLAAEVEKRNCAVPFKIQGRADLMTPEIAGALKRAGCAEVWMGVESGSQKVLDAMDKGLRVENVISARHNLQRQGIRACYFLQFGYPGESYEDIRETVALVRETRPDDIGVSFSYPLPNTKFHELVRQQIGPKRNWSDSEDLCVMFKGAYTDDFYRAIRDALHAEVDSWHANALFAEDSKAHARHLWTRVELLEPGSRNQDATAFPFAAADSSGGDSNRHSDGSLDFVSIHGLHTSARES